MFREKIKALTIFSTLMMSALFSSWVQAYEVYLEPGESRVVQTQENIDTVFISSADIADYELVSDNSLVLYGRKEGRADFTAFDKSGRQIIQIALVVNNLLGNVDKMIRTEFSDSNVSIQRSGSSYLLSGTVPNEEARDRIYQIVGEGVGAEKIEVKKKVKETSDGGGGSDEQAPSFLSEVTYKGVINKLRLPITNQVNVKLSIVEVTKDFTDNVGIDWSTIGQNAGTFNFIKFDADSLSNLVHAIKNDSIAKVLAEPNLSVMSGETADFLVGGEIPIVTTSQNGTNVQYKEFGIKLNIGAKVGDTRRIRLTLGEEVSSLDNLYNTAAGDSFPALKTRRARTTVELGDGESFLLGGLINTSEKEALARVPYVGDVPILGAFFRNAKTERNRTELVVVATVNLVKPVSSRDIVFPNFVQTSTTERFFNFTGFSDSRNKKRAVEFLSKGGFIK
ncbi:Pullulanase secretion envelope pulD [Pragia fontium]|uniref:Pilus assembly protein CpaC n=3 Tax=Pragia fontium TaxID=82985 RepID=A0AAJ5BG19_9GAMM|nr:pilus assembly protein N-terminal domain-containing protein [Pragia fontium]GKX63305.1 secretin [Pragia fontium]SFC13747.1 pilus assembly protein CpaC [Pragia fontium DSM 5563 = ATCC 49100]SUB81320.1 Pullulanase secretion envelope pulD [Pragia fontium]VEJ53494.1 Pullulanase secretion envelope pulD [Pragia fontium]